MKSRNLNRSACLRRAERLEERKMLTSWGLDAIDAPEVWEQGYYGQGVVVAVIDSGIDVHVDLIPNIWVNHAETVNRRDDDGNGFVDDLNGWNFVDDNNNPIGTNDHGSHVAGTIAADDNGYGTTGVAHKAKIMPLRVFDDGGVGTTTDVADAVRYAIDNGADIINLSVGGPETRSMTLALQYAAEQNVLIVAASGNDHADEPVYPAIYSAELANVISVGAHDRSFEAVTSTNQVGRSGAIQVDAPGVGIESTVSQNGFANSGGTSTAAAHVAGVAALMLSANRSLTAAELRDGIVSSAARKVAGSESVGAVNARIAVALTVGSANAAAIPTDAEEADFDGNGVVDFGDFLTVAKNFGRFGVDHESGDVNGDGRVLFNDFLVLAQTYGESVAGGSRRNREVSSAESKAAAQATDVTFPIAVAPSPTETDHVPASNETSNEDSSNADTGEDSIPEVQPSPEVVDTALNEVLEEERVWTAGDLLASLFSSRL